MASLDVSRLNPLDISGLTELDAGGLDTTGLNLLDTSGLSEVTEYTPPDIGDFDYHGRLRTASSSLVRGFTTTLSGIPKSVALMGTPNPEVLANLDRMDAGKFAIPKRVSSGGPADFTLDLPDPHESFYEQYQAADKKERRRTRTAFEARFNEDVNEAQDSALYRAGEAMDKFVADVFPVNPEFQEEFIAGKVPQGLGSAFGFVAMTALTRKVAGKSSAITFGTPAVLGSGMNRADQFEQALNEGATLAEAIRVADIGAITGMSEAIPIGHLFGRLDKVTGGAVKKWMLRAAIQGTEEAVQEAGLGIINAAVAAEVYDSQRGVWNMERLDEAAVGFTTGALLETLFTLAMPRTRGKRTPSNGDPDGTPASRSELQEHVQANLDRLNDTPDLSEEEVAERDFLNENIDRPNVLAAAYGVNLQPAGFRELAVETVPDLSQEDIQSPIDNEIILAGRISLQDAAGVQTANELLSDNDFPAVGSNIRVDNANAIVVDAWIDEEGKGAKIRYDNGEVVAETFDKLEGRVKGLAVPAEEETPIQVPEQPAQAEEPDDLDTAVTAIQQKYGLEELNVLENDGGEIEVYHILVPGDSRGEGTGTKAMNEIIAYADSVNKPVVVNAAYDTSTGRVKPELDRFYKSLGFEGDVTGRYRREVSAPTEAIPAVAVPEPTTPPIEEATAPDDKDQEPDLDTADLIPFPDKPPGARPTQAEEINADEVDARGREDFVITQNDADYSYRVEFEPGLTRVWELSNGKKGVEITGRGTALARGYEIADTARFPNRDKSDLPKHFNEAAPAASTPAPKAPPKRKGLLSGQAVEEGSETANLIAQAKDDNAVREAASAAGIRSDLALTDDASRLVTTVMADRQRFDEALESNGTGSDLGLGQPVVMLEYEYGVVIDTIGAAIAQGDSKKSFGELLAIEPVPTDVDLSGNQALWGMTTDNHIRQRQTTRNEYKLALDKPALVNTAVRETKRQFLATVSAADAALIRDKLDIEPDQFWRNATNGNIEHATTIAQPSSKRAQWTKKGRSLVDLDAQPGIDAAPEVTDEQLNDPAKIWAGELTQPGRANLLRHAGVGTPNEADVDRLSRMFWNNMSDRDRKAITEALPTFEVGGVTLYAAEPKNVSGGGAQANFRRSKQSLIAAFENDDVGAADKIIEKWTGSPEHRQGLLAIYAELGDALDSPQATDPSVIEGQAVAKAQQLFVVRDGQKYPVDSLEDAAVKWDSFREETGAGSSQIGSTEVVDQDGKEVAHISYNGRIWPPGGFKPGVKPLVLRPGEKPATEGDKGTRGLLSETAPETGPAQGYTIEEYTHTKKGIQMHLVIPAEQLERDDFNQMRREAKAAGGWYSRKWGKTPGGFAFESAQEALDFGAAQFPTSGIATKVDEKPEVALPDDFSAVGSPQAGEDWPTVHRVRQALQALQEDPSKRGSNEFQRINGLVKQIKDPAVRALASDALLKAGQDPALDEPSPKKIATPQVPALEGMAPLGAKPRNKKLLPKGAIGFNGNGLPLFEDENGVRAYQESGIRIAEAAMLQPGGGVSIDKSKRGQDYLTEEELTPELREDQQPEVERLSGTSAAVADRISPSQDFGDLTIEEEVQIEGEAGTTILSQPAQRAFEAARDRVKTLEGIAKCLTT